LFFHRGKTDSWRFGVRIFQPWILFPFGVIREDQFQGDRRVDNGQPAFPRDTCTSPPASALPLKQNARPLTKEQIAAISRAFEMLARMDKGF
jgi:hypothetical protein